MKGPQACRDPRPPLRGQRCQSSAQGNVSPDRGLCLLPALCGTQRPTERGFCLVDGAVMVRSGGMGVKCQEESRSRASQGGEPTPAGDASAPGVFNFYFPYSMEGRGAGSGSTLCPRRAQHTVGALLRARTSLAHLPAACQV